MAQIRFPNLAQTTLTGVGIGVGGASFTVANAAAFGASDFYVRVEDAAAGVPVGTTLEYMRVTLVAGSTFSVTKGLAGTADQAHPSGSFVTAVLIDLALINGLVQQIVGATEIALSPSGGQGTVTLSVPDASIKTRRLTLENNITRVGPAVQSPAGITPGAGVWGNWGTSYTITPAVVSDLMIFVSANISATNLSAFLMQVLVDGAVTALNPLAGADITVANKTLCVSLIDRVAGATAAAHTIQVQLKPIAAVTLGSGATGLDIFVLAIPST